MDVIFRWDEKVKSYLLFCYIEIKFPKNCFLIRASKWKIIKEINSIFINKKRKLIGKKKKKKN
jgi:hypothetical protein